MHRYSSFAPAQFFVILFEASLARNDRFWNHFWKGACQKCFQNISFRVRRPSKSRYSNSRLAYARQHFALKSRVSSTRNVNFASEAEAKGSGEAQTSQDAHLAPMHAWKADKFRQILYIQTPDPPPRDGCYS